MLQGALAAVFVGVGLALMMIPRSDVAAFVGGREDELISGIRFIGFMTVIGGLLLIAPLFLRSRILEPRKLALPPAPRAWVTDVLALLSLVVGLVLIGRGHAYSGFALAALSYVLVSAAACFAIWRPEDMKLRAALPERWQRRVFHLPANA